MGEDAIPGAGYAYGSSWRSAAPRETGPDLAAFARAIFEAERGGWDGGDLQDLGVKTGVLVPEQRTESCGEQCACADFCGPDEAPWTCYRLHPSLLAAPRPDAGEGGNA